MQHKAMKKIDPTRILAADVMKKFSVRSLAALLEISRPAVDHWRLYVPKTQAAKLQERCPNWRRRPDFDPEPYKAALKKAAELRAETESKRKRNEAVRSRRAAKRKAVS